MRLWRLLGISSHKRTCSCPYTHTHTHTHTDTPTRATVIYVWTFDYVKILLDLCTSLLQDEITSALGIQIKYLRKHKTCYTPPQVYVIVLKQFLIPKLLRIQRSPLELRIKHLVLLSHAPTRHESKNVQPCLGKKQFRLSNFTLATRWCIFVVSIPDEIELVQRCCVSCHRMCFHTAALSRSAGSISPYNLFLALNIFIFKHLILGCLTYKSSIFPSSLIYYV
jgi:hypothetical protein